MADDFGAPGQVDRSRIEDELRQKPWLRERLNQMVRGEVGSKASDEVRRIQMETAMNRALARGHSLEQALWDTGMAGSRGYYPRASFTRGGYDKDTFGGDLDAVLAGSNYAGKYGKGLITGNASADVAQHQFQRGTPGFTLQTGSGPESYFSEGPFGTGSPSSPQIAGATPSQGDYATPLARVAQQPAQPPNAPREPTGYAAPLENLQRLGQSLMAAGRKQSQLPDVQSGMPSAISQFIV